MASPQHDLLRILVFLLYLFILPAVYWKLAPRLPSFAKGLTATLLLAQVIIVALALQLQSQDSVLAKLVDVTEEQNPAVALAGLQLALVAAYSLLIAWLARAAPNWQRLYYLGLGAVFLYLSWDELFVLHEGMPNWAIYYLGAGVVIVTATLIVVWRSPRRRWIWHGSFLAGLAVSALGAIVLEHLRFPDTCRALGLYYIDKCLLKYIEEPMEFLGIWLALVAMLGLMVELAPALKRRPRMLHLGLPALALLAIVTFSDPDLNKVMRKTGADLTDLRYEDGARVYGFQTELASDAAFVESTLWLSAPPFGYAGLGYSLHLLDQASGSTLAGKDEYVTVAGGSVLGPAYLPIFRQTLRLSLPPEARANRGYWLVLRLWREVDGAFISQRALASDRRTLSETQIVLDELVVPAAPVATSGVPSARFDTGFVFYAADVPASASPAESLNLAMTWRADAAGEQDYTQFLHLVHEENGALWAFDQQPLGARLPTRLWYSGLADTEIWRIPLPEDLTPGRYEVWTGLYRADDQARLGASDAAGAPYPHARVPLGAIIIEPA